MAVDGEGGAEDGGLVFENVDEVDLPVHYCGKTKGFEVRREIEEGGVWTGTYK